MGCGASSTASDDTATNKVHPVDESKSPEIEKESSKITFVYSEETTLPMVQDELEEWKNLIEYLQSKNYLMDYALSQNREHLGSKESLKSFIINSPASNDIERLWIIFVWITHNINYDMNIYKIRNYRPEGDTFITGYAVCSGYSDLFKELCDACVLECETINGYAKGLGYTMDKSFKDTNHAWNVVKIDGEWKFIDSTWGAGYGKLDTLEAVKLFRPHYFFSPFEVVKYTHFSNEVQLDDYHLTIENFEKLPKLDLFFFLFGFKFKALEESTITRNINPFVLTLTAKENTSLMADLKDFMNNKIENSIFVQQNPITNDFEVNVLAPKCGHYKLTLYGATSTSKEHDSIAEFLVEMKDIDSNDKKFCNSFLYNSKHYLYGPRFLSIKSNELIIFKIYIENVTKVAIIDTKNQFFHFEKSTNEDNIWYLEKEFSQKGELLLGASIDTKYDILYSYKII